MALAEARAAWQRTANRCFVQEDAKRAPKLACCPSLPPLSKEPELGTSDSAGVQIIPLGVLVPSDREPLGRNLSYNTQWCLHPQQGYGYHNRLMDERLTVVEGGDDETSHFKEGSQDFFDTEADFVIVDQTSAESVRSDHYDLFKSDVNCFDLDSSWTGVEKSSPWWRTADTEGLASLVAQRSCSLIENCDLPSPQNPRGKTDTSAFSVRGNTVDQGSYRKHGSGSEGRLYGARHGEAAAIREDTSEILDALRHSQTRARDSDKLARQACAEKEHIVKILLRQASLLFAYKQWLKLVQLENIYLRSLRGKSRQVFPTFPQMQQPFRRMRMNMRSRKPVERCGGCGDIGKYVMVFAVGLGLVGVGLMLGWSLAWILPSW